MIGPTGNASGNVNNNNNNEESHGTVIQRLRRSISGRFRALSLSSESPLIPQDAIQKASVLFQALQAVGVSSFQQNDLERVCDFIASESKKLPAHNVRYDKKKTKLKISVFYLAKSHEFFLKNIQKKIGDGNERTYALWQTGDGKVLAAGKTLLLKPSSEKNNAERKMLIESSNREVSALKKFIGNKQIIQFYNNIDESQKKGKKKLTILVEYCPGNSYCEGKQLYDILQHFNYERKVLDFRQVLQIFYDSLRGLSSLEEQEVIHRDIKTENFLVRESQKEQKFLRVILNDFGYAIELDKIESEQEVKLSGSLGYLSPEIFSCDQLQVDSNEFYVRNLYRTYGHYADVWATACALFAVLNQCDIDWTQELGQMDFPTLNESRFQKVRASHRLFMGNLLNKKVPEECFSTNTIIQENLETLYALLNSLIFQMLAWNTKELVNQTNGQRTPPRISGSQALAFFKQSLGDKILAILEE